MVSFQLFSKHLLKISHFTIPYHIFSFHIEVMFIAEVTSRQSTAVFTVRLKN